jgi:type II secretory pathway component PulF
MSKDKETTIKLGSFTTLLTIVFIALKLTNVISWSWFWVLSPMIFSFIGGIVFVIVIALILFIALLSNR